MHRQGKGTDIHHSTHGTLLLFSPTTERNWTRHSSCMRNGEYAFSYTLGHSVHMHSVTSHTPSINSLRKFTYTVPHAETYQIWRNDNRGGPYLPSRHGLAPLMSDAKVRSLISILFPLNTLGSDGKSLTFSDPSKPHPDHDSCNRVESIGGIEAAKQSPRGLRCNDAKHRCDCYVVSRLVNSNLKAWLVLVEYYRR